MRRGAGYLAALLLVAGAFSLGFFLTQSEEGTSQSAPPVRTERPVRLIDEVRAELASGYYRWIVNSFSGSGSYNVWLQTP